MAAHAGVVLVILGVEDVQQAAAFYRRVFEWPTVVEVPVYVELQAGALRVGLYQRDGFARNTGIPSLRVPPGGLTASELYVHVDDPEAVLARLVDCGARALSPWALRDWGDHAAYWADPDGNVLVVARPG